MSDTQRIFHLRKMAYEDYLKTPEWAAKREQTLERDGYRCRVCDEGENLQVHHRTYARRGDEDLNDLTTLCQRCHEHFHKIIFQVDMIGQTYEEPKDEQEKVDPRRQGEELLLGMILQYPELILHVIGILNTNEFRDEETQSLYQVCCEQAEQKIHVETLPANLSTLAKQCQQTYIQSRRSVRDRDKSGQIKDIIQISVRLKRMCVMESYDHLKQLLREATKAGDNVFVRQCQEQMLEVHRQLRTMDSATYSR